MMRRNLTRVLIERMEPSELDAVFAKEILGCKVIWWEPYRDYCCHCGNGAHAGDQQCSILPGYSSWPDYLVHVLKAAEDLGVKYSVREGQEAILRKVLAAHRLRV